MLLPSPVTNTIPHPTPSGTIIAWSSSFALCCNRFLFVDDGCCLGTLDVFNPRITMEITVGVLTSVNVTVELWMTISQVVPR